MFEEFISSPAGDAIDTHMMKRDLSWVTDVSHEMKTAALHTDEVLCLCSSHTAHTQIFTDETGSLIPQLWLHFKHFMCKTDYTTLVINSFFFSIVTVVGLMLTWVNEINSFMSLKHLSNVFSNILVKVDT